MTERRYQHHIFISWIDNERANLAAVFQADIRPCFPAIDGLEDSGAVRRVAADRRFSSAGVDYIVIGRRDGDRANGGNRFLIE